MLYTPWRAQKARKLSDCNDKGGRNVEVWSFAVYWGDWGDIRWHDGLFRYGDAGAVVPEWPEMPGVVYEIDDGGRVPSWGGVPDAGRWHDMH